MTVPPPTTAGRATASAPTAFSGSHPSHPSAPAGGPGFPPPRLGRFTSGPSLTPPPGFGPPGPTPTGSTPATSRRGPAVLLGLFVGVLVCTVVAVALLFTGVVRWGAASGSGPSTVAAAGTSTAGSAADQRPVTLPDSIGNLRREVLVLADHGSGAQQVRDGVGRQTDRTVAALTATYGAGAGAAAYSEEDLDAVVWAMVVRTAVPSPVVLPAGPTADELGLAAVPREVLTSGEVHCVVQNDAVPAGQDVTPVDRHVLSCQRGDATRTVITTFTAQPTVEYAVRFTDEVWDATAAA